MTSRPSEAQRRVLLLMAGGDFNELETVGPVKPTLKGMARRGWVVWHGGQWVLTEAGQELAKGIVGAK